MLAGFEVTRPEAQAAETTSVAGVVTGVAQTGYEVTNKLLMCSVGLWRYGGLSPTAAITAGAILAAANGVLQAFYIAVQAANKGSVVDLGRDIGSVEEPDKWKENGVAVAVMLGALADGVEFGTITAVGLDNGMLGALAFAQRFYKVWGAEAHHLWEKWAGSRTTATRALEDTVPGFLVAHIGRVPGLWDIPYMVKQMQPLWEAGLHKLSVFKVLEDVLGKIPAMAMAFFLAGAGTFDAQHTDQRYLRALYKGTGKAAGLEHVLNSVADAFAFIGPVIGRGPYIFDLVAGLSPALVEMLEKACTHLSMGYLAGGALQTTGFEFVQAFAKEMGKDQQHNFFAEHNEVYAWTLGAVAFFAGIAEFLAKRSDIDIKLQERYGDDMRHTRDGLASRYRALFTAWRADGDRVAEACTKAVAAVTEAASCGEEGRRWHEGWRVWAGRHGTSPHTGLPVSLPTGDSDGGGAGSYNALSDSDSGSDTTEP